MKLLAQLNLFAANQAAGLLQTLETANTACDVISVLAWQQRTFGKYRLQKRCYAAMRKQYKPS